MSEAVGKIKRLFDPLSGDEPDISEVSKWFIPMSEEMVAKFMSRTTVPTWSFIVHLSDYDINTFLLTCKSESQLERLRITCHPDMGKYSIGHIKPMLFNSLFEIVFNILLSRLQIKIEDEADLVPSMYNKCMIPSETWFIAGICKFQRSKFYRKGQPDTFAVWMSEEGGFKIGIRTETAVDIIDIFTSGKGYSIDMKHHFRTVEELVRYYGKYCMNAPKYDKILPKPHVCSSFYVSMISQRIDSLSVKREVAGGKSCTGFELEFNEVAARSAENKFPYSVSSKNRQKNRYGNVPAYDHTRVKLYDCDNDYINANYVKADVKSKSLAYILCQGPKPNTIEDMWRMIIQENVKTIVILTGLVEKSVVKCEKYWPELEESRNLWDEYKITTVKEGGCENIGVITISIDKNDGTFNSWCKIYHYKSWPDCGVPDDPWALLKLLLMTNERRDKYPLVPTIVHCSAGIGRTGTFVMLDIIMNQIKYQGVSTIVDIMETLIKLRTQRTSLVQTLTQYEFIYAAINAYLNWRLGKAKFINEKITDDE
ncbi:Tyrosine-protein phosphatase non-receptor type 6 [Thelohanellus kitauei]|uniref:Tyrosine-protein phosphatase non-receptor type 6 n=1 Tax=Thelohanellus kitauei TaxID=669202 RepID=A0A0C2M9M2_THEKT|nr:Tyrosine-protein phosphatase non-receptor type 6 [Thelohanellus kitauei]